MSKLVVKPQQPDSEGRVLTVTPQSAGWKYVGFEVYRLGIDASLSRDTQDREVGIVVLSGCLQAQVSGEDCGEIGRRMDIFEGTPAYVLYVPHGQRFELHALTEAEFAVCSAPGRGDLPPRVIRPDDVEAMNRGTGSMRRRIHNLLPENEAADSLLLVEVYTPGGNWSSYPPHKHDTPRAGSETQLEETYYHRINPKQGFAFQRVYTDDRSLDEALAVNDGECVLVPRGYHPVAAPVGYHLYYLNVMAGPTRQWLFHNDPDHEWLFQGVRSDD